MTENINHKEILEKLYHKGKFQKMIDYCDAQIIVSPDNYLFYGAKGKAYQELENYELSIVFFSKAIELFPTYAQGFLNRGIGYYFSDNNELSKSDFENAVYLDTSLEINASYYLTIIYFDLEYYDQSIKFANIYLTEYEVLYIQYIKAKSFFYSNDFERSITDFEVIISNKSEDNHFVLDSLFLQALCFSNIKNEARELENYSLIIENYKIDSETDLDINIVLEHRANWYFLNKQLEAGLKDIETILLNQRELIPEIELINSQNFEAKKDTIICNTSIDNPFQVIDFSIIKEEQTLQVNMFDSRIQLSFCKIKKGKEIGIYILSFANGEFYVGQTTNFNVRIKQHILNHEDLQKVYFKTVDNEILTETETQTIAILEQNLIRIRNGKQINFVNIFGKENQINWKNDLNFNYNSGTRFNNQLVRSQLAKQFFQLQQFEFYDKLISFLARFIQRIIPNYQASEFNYWNITCLPKFLPKEKCITRININSVPILSIYFNDNSQLRVMLIGSKLPFLKYISKNDFVEYFSKINSLQIDFRDDFFDFTDGDEIRMWINEPDFESFLNNDVIIESLRLMTIRMMNKTGFEVNYKRKFLHCLDLSDAIFEKINNSNNTLNPQRFY